jgi:hypothetical protein
MNRENINAIISAIEKLNEEGIDVQLNPRNILDDFELIQQRAQHGGNTLSSEYRMIKIMQSSVQKSLVAIKDDDIPKFVKLYAILEQVRNSISREYEKKKIMDNRINLLQKLVNDSNSQNEIQDQPQDETPNESLVNLI